MVKDFSLMSLPCLSASWFSRRKSWNQVAITFISVQTRRNWMTYFGKTTGSDVAHLAQFQYVSILLIWRAANKKFVNGQTKNRSVSGHDNKQVAPGITHPRLWFPVDEETIFVNLKEAVGLPVACIFLLQTAQDVVISTWFRRRERETAKRVLCPFSAKHRALVYSKRI